MKASFNGDIPEIPGISVDNFEKTDKRAYFLSHCHTDHTTGLNSLYCKLPEAGVFIYMSEPSAAIVETYIDERLKNYIRPLRLCNPTTICIPRDETNNYEEVYVTVTLSPAGHCFGSVMFLFETTLKKILYTGDFRVSENLSTNLAKLHDKNGKPIKLDVLYVDTTFQNPKYEIFPKRTETMENVIGEITKWINEDDNNYVAIVPSARYGYEYVLNEIYKRIQMKVYVSNRSNGELYRKFPELVPSVTDRQDTKVHLCSTYRQYCEACETPRNYLYIKFSAMRFEKFKPEDLLIQRSGDNMFVCFATHCSRSELTYFIEYLSPKKVVGFPNEYMPVKRPADVTPLKRFTPVKSAEKRDKGTPKKVPKGIQKKLFGL